MAALQIDSNMRTRLEKLIYSAIAFGVALITSANASEIIQATDYHADEAQVMVSAPWLGLQWADDGWRLVPANLKFIPIEDPITDEGIRVESDVQNALVFISDEKLTAGQVGRSLAGHFVGGMPEKNDESSRMPGLGRELLLHLNDSEYKLMNADNKIVLVSNNVAQHLFDYFETVENNAEILWVGDLDRDGKLDLLLDASEHYNVGELRLYLSERAKEGALVQLVAVRRTTGC